MPVEVLLVEDNPADVELIHVAVSDAGLPHRLLVVPDGESALAYLRAAERPPQLLLLDINMPRLGGLGVLQALRDEGRVIRAVTFSSSEAERDRLEALAWGAEAHVVKPVSFEAFTRVIVEVLREYAPLPAAGEPARQAPD